MTRHLLTAALLVLAVSAHAVSPARQDADGGGSCPPVDAIEVSDEGDAVADAQPELRASAPAAPVPAAKRASVPPRSGARWHSFLPGMFK